MVVRPSIRKTSALLNNYGLSTDGGLMVEKVVSVTMRRKAAGDGGGGGGGRRRRRGTRLSECVPEVCLPV